ncbi:MAG: hypothetical protein H6907_17235 [Hyphomicrobiales bacterium]|nr:hypothetical protein [Hyphomicrobiales bacterium]
MKTTEKLILNRLLVSTAVALALVATPLLVAHFTDSGLSLTGTALADEDGDGGGGGKGKQAMGSGGGGQGNGPGAIGGIGKGQGGPGDDSDGKGPRSGAGKPDGGGGKPVWAQEGIPEVELGRLNVARAPAHVLDSAVEEALKNFDTATMESFYELTAEAAANLLETDYDNVVRIDSPLENLGLYRDLLTSGTSPLPGVTPASTLDLAAILLGSASDKTVAVTTDTVIAINTIFGLTMSEADVAAVADMAEDVRAAINTGHGE